MALWQGTYKVSQTLRDAKAKHKAPFVLSQNTWKSIGKEVKLSNHTTPSQIAPHVGDIHTKTHWTADTQSYFLMFLGPIVMRNRLPPEYYKHFILLSEIAKRLTMQEIAYAQFATLRKDILSWVKSFERRVSHTTLARDCLYSHSLGAFRLYYKFEKKFIPFCTAPIHTLLHMVDCIEWQGPPCYYWCFSIERYGGWLKRWAGQNNQHCDSFGEPRHTGGAGEYALVIGRMTYRYDSMLTRCVLRHHRAGMSTSSNM